MALASRGFVLSSGPKQPLGYRSIHPRGSWYTRFLIFWQIGSNLGSWDLDPPRGAKKTTFWEKMIHMSGRWSGIRRGRLEPILMVNYLTLRGFKRYMFGVQQPMASMCTGPLKNLEQKEPKITSCMWPQRMPRKSSILQIWRVKISDPLPSTYGDIQNPHSSQVYPQPSTQSGTSLVPIPPDIAELRSI